MPVILLGTQLMLVIIIITNTFLTCIYNVCGLERKNSFPNLVKEQLEGQRNSPLQG